MEIENNETMDDKESQFRDPTPKDWIAGIVLLSFYLIVLVLGAFFLIPEFWYWWLVIFAICTIFLVIKQNSHYAYRCRDCGSEFEVSFIINLISLHGVDKQGSWSRVKCPQCQRSAKASVIKIV